MVRLSRHRSARSPTRGPMKRRQRDSGRRSLPDDFPLPPLHQQPRQVITSSRTGVPAASSDMVRFSCRVLRGPNSHLQHVWRGDQLMSSAQAFVQGRQQQQRLPCVCGAGAAADAVAGATRAEHPPLRRGWWRRRHLSRRAGLPEPRPRSFRYTARGLLGLCWQEDV